ncbi:hypothetical protein PanWU01x14_065220 [Parasponia andersonii]|uniref:DUF506 family protein n=1 Tax=Parasponia andersonii TaxID=3476 RepID=A0A2P5DGT6_PARAD|nr:hypothetical protein PanWU01x14_065220 [Parasponia andersonii]
MGSLEEEKLVQMVHDFIESETNSTAPLLISPHHHYSNSLPLNNQAQYFTLQEILGLRTETEAEILESVLKYMGNKKDALKFTSQKNYLVMRLKMDGYNASLCHSSWVTSLGCPAGDYEYIETMVGEGPNDNTKRLIVDIDFKSQFELARPTPAYKQLTDSLPLIFVGHEDKLIRIISLLCTAAKQSLRERGLHVPPWRTASYMQSKWLSPVSSCAHKEETVTNAKDTTKDMSGHSTFISKWAPPIVVKPNKRRDLGGGSGLSSQFSNMKINCC